MCIIYPYLNKSEKVATTALKMFTENKHKHDLFNLSAMAQNVLGNNDKALKN